MQLYIYIYIFKISIHKYIKAYWPRNHIHRPNLQHAKQLSHSRCWSRAWTTPCGCWLAFCLTTLLRRTRWPNEDLACFSLMSRFLPSQVFLYWPWCSSENNCNDYWFTTLQTINSQREWWLVSPILQSRIFFTINTNERIETQILSMLTACFLILIQQ